MSIQTEDILILRSIIDYRILVEDPTRLITGGNYYIDEMFEPAYVKKSFERLLLDGLIRQNDPKEFLPFFNKAELQKLLTNTGLKGLRQLAKDPLIELASQNLADEDIVQSDYYKPYYQITDEGLETIDKYTNVIWFIQNRFKIFGRSDHSNKFSTQYFFTHPYVDPYKEMIAYYENKNYDVTGRLYLLKRDFKESINYGIKSITKTLSKSIKYSIESSYGIDIFSFKREFIELDWISEAYSNIDENEKDFSSVIKESYNNLQYKNEVSMQFFSDIVNALLLNDVDVFDSLESKLISTLQDMVPEKDNFEKLEEQVMVAQENEAALLDLLISHMDLELLTRMKERIELRIAEIKDIWKISTAFIITNK